MVHSHHVYTRSMCNFNFLHKKSIAVLQTHVYVISPNLSPPHSFHLLSLVLYTLKSYNGVSDTFSGIQN